MELLLYHHAQSAVVTQSLLGVALAMLNRLHVRLGDMLPTLRKYTGFQSLVG